MGDVLNRAGAQWEPRLLANLYPAAALQADDGHGEEHDQISAGTAQLRLAPKASPSR